MEINENIKQIKGKKLEMSQVFMLDGKVVPVTKIRALEDVDSDMENKEVVLIGITKGKGFAGVMKKWGFAGGQATRGQSDKARAAGAIGSQTPGRVLRGKKMAGRMGNKQITLKGLKILKVDTNLNELTVSGPIPGSRNSEVTIRFI
jgi:large subunit ribosomal protein L3